MAGKMTDKALKDKDEAHESNSALDAYGQALKIADKNYQTVVNYYSA